MRSLQFIFLIFSFAFTQTMVFSLCEGNFQASNASLWYFNQNLEFIEGPNNPIGDTAQSMTVNGNKLYVIMNGSGLIHIYNISENELEFDHSFAVEFEGPRYLLIINDTGYLTDWNTNQIKVLDLTAETVVAAIPAGGLPEDIITDGESIYVSINMNSDWSSGNSVLKIDPDSFEITNEYTVANNPEILVILDNFLYVSSTYYDANWNTYYAISSINLTSGESIIFEDNSGLMFGPDLVSADGNIYRGTATGAIRIDPLSLNVVEGSEIGNFSDVYSMDYHNGNFYLGLTDFTAPDEIAIIDTNNNFVSTYTVGAIPGSFAFWDNDLSTEPISLIEQFKINRVYPNPFNPEIKIEINIKDYSMLSVSIYDIKGQIVDKIYQGETAPGLHRFLWNASAISSGIYFINVSDEHKMISERIILQK